MRRFIPRHNGAFQFSVLILVRSFFSVLVGAHVFRLLVLLTWMHTTTTGAKMVFVRFIVIVQIASIGSIVISCGILI